MATYPTTTFTRNILVADDLVDAEGDQVELTTASCGFEIQSTNFGFVLPRMTTTQRDDLTETDGMMVYNTTTASVDTCQSSRWGPGIACKVGSLTAQNLIDMYGSPVIVLPVLTGSYTYLIHRFFMAYLAGTAFTNGGNIFLQYDLTGNAGGTPATGTLGNTMLTTTNSYVGSADGLLNPVLTTTVQSKGIYITNANPAFQGGGTATTTRATYSIFYSVVDSD